MNALDRYLRRATRGLPRHDRARVCEELISSLLERTAEHQIDGKSRAEALALALEEFGDPAPLAAGMRRVHLWPKISVLGGFASILLATLWLTLPHGTAQQVQITTQGLVPRCTPHGPPPGARNCTANESYWINLQSLTEQLKKQGATLTPTTETITSRLMTDGPPRQFIEQRMQVTWPDGGGRTAQFELPLTDNWGSAIHAERQKKWREFMGERYSPFAFPAYEQVFQRDGKTYLEANMVTDFISSTATVPLTVERPFDAPILHIGRLRLELGQPGQGSNVTRMIEGAVTWIFSRSYTATVFYGKHYSKLPGSLLSPETGYAQSVRVKGQPGDVYAIVFPVTANGVNGLNFDLVTVNAQGVLNFRTGPKNVRYTRDIKALANGGEKKPVVALLHLGSKFKLKRDDYSRQPGGLPRQYSLELPRQ